MVARLRLVLVIIGNALVALSALASLAVYTSNEPSGLQYIGLIPAALLAGMAVGAGVLLVLLSLRYRVARLNLALAVVALLVTLLPEAVGYGGAALTVSGAVLAAALLPLAPVVMVAVVRGLGPLAE
jgi:hypothetical protein